MYACTRIYTQYAHTHLHPYTLHEYKRTYTHTHLCWVVPCSITDVAAYDLATPLDSDTGLLHNVWRWCLYLQFIIIPDVLCICNCNACCFVTILPRVRSNYRAQNLRTRYDHRGLSVFADMLSRYRYVVLKTMVFVGNDRIFFAGKDRDHKIRELESIARARCVLYRRR